MVLTRYQGEAAVLSKHEMQILLLMFAGLCSKQIANELRVSVSTVEKRRSHAMRWFLCNRVIGAQQIMLQATNISTLPSWQLFSQRQLEVIGHIAAGLSNDEIALQMKIAVSTVEKHISAIFARSTFTNRFQIIIWGMHHGFCRDE